MEHEISFISRFESDQIAQIQMEVIVYRIASSKTWVLALRLVVLHSWKWSNEYWKLLYIRYWLLSYFMLIHRTLFWVLPFSIKKLTSSHDWSFLAFCWMTTLTGSTKLFCLISSFMKAVHYFNIPFTLYV